MIEFDRSDKKMVLKLVFYGHALSGKTTISGFTTFCQSRAGET